MQYYFLKGSDIGYLDMGLFNSHYTALIFSRMLAREANHGKTYYLYGADNICLAEIICRPTARYKWIGMKRISDKTD